VNRRVILENVAARSMEIREPTRAPERVDCENLKI